MNITAKPDLENGTEKWEGDKRIKIYQTGSLWSFLSVSLSNKELIRKSQTEGLTEDVKAHKSKRDKHADGMFGALRSGKHLAAVEDRIFDIQGECGHKNAFSQ
jgi:hypothetical protein